MDAEGTTDGYRFKHLVDTTAKRFTNFSDYVFALRFGPYCFALHILHPFSLVLPGSLPGTFGRAHVFRYRGISPLLFAPRVQDQPRISVRDRVYGHELRAKGRVVVGGASSAPPPPFRPGAGSALTNAVWIFLVARGLDHVR